jgi:hypothetical protein
MTRTRWFTPAAVAMAIAIAAGPALAQSRPRERTRPPELRAPSADAQGSAPAGDTQERSADSNRSRGDVAVRRTEPPPPDAGRGGRDEGRGQSNNRSYNNGRDNGRGYDNGRYGSGRDTGRYGNGRDYHYGRYPNYPPGYRPGYGWNHGNPYPWRSHIRFGLGVSVFAGSPFRFLFHYGWRPSFPYHYQMYRGVAYGGMSFLLDPDWAEVYIDGVYVGVVRDFGGQPVPVAAGFHRIELYAPGFEPVGFDVNVLPGQVIPYRGTLYRGYW